MSKLKTTLATIGAIIGLAGGAYVINDIASRSKPADNKPLEQTTEEEATKRNISVFDENTTFDEKTYKLEHKPSDILPMPISAQFKDINDDMTKKTYHRAMFELIVPLREDYAKELRTSGRTGFGIYEIMQILGRNVDKITEDKDGNEDGLQHLGEITYNEVRSAIKKYQTEGKAGFKIDILPGKTKAITTKTFDEMLDQELEARINVYEDGKQLANTYAERSRLARQRFNQSEAQRLQADVKYQRERR